MLKYVPAWPTTVHPVLGLKEREISVAKIELAAAWEI